MSKKGPLFVRRLSVFWGFLALRKNRSPASKKYILAGRHGLDPLKLNADKLQLSAIKAAGTVGQKVKSSFTEGLGKRKKVIKGGSLAASRPAAKQCATGMH